MDKNHYFGQKNTTTAFFRQNKPRTTSITTCYGVCTVLLSHEIAVMLRGFHSFVAGGFAKFKYFRG